MGIQQNCLVQQNLGPIIFSSQKFWVKKNVRPKIFWVQKISDLTCHNLIWLDPNWLDLCWPDLNSPDLTKPLPTWLDLPQLDMSWLDLPWLDLHDLNCSNLQVWLLDELTTIWECHLVPPVCLVHYLIDLVYFIHLVHLVQILPSSAQAQAQAQLGAEIALFSQLWGTTIHHTPYTLHPTRSPE